MILVDLNQVMISNLMVQIGGQKGVELEEDLFRHMILNSLRAIRRKFNNEYGELSNTLANIDELQFDI